MDILIAVIITGFAVSFVNETLINLTESYFSGRVMRHVLTLPLSFLGCWYLDVLGFTLIVAAPAAGFVALALSKMVNNPTAAQQVITRR